MSAINSAVMYLNKNVVPAGAVTLSQEEKDAVTAAILASKAKNTRRVYEVQFKAFSEYCAAHNAQDLPAAPAIVAAYLTSLGKNGKSASTITQAAAAIKEKHIMKGFTGEDVPTNSPAVKMAISGARRQVGTAVHKKAAVTPEILRALVASCDVKTVKGLRDRALLLLGFAGAFRRSELAALNWEDIEQTTDAAGRRAFLITVKRSKTDQTGAGMVKGIFTAKDAELCPIRALEKYRAAISADDGAPVFQSLAYNGKGARLSGYSVAEIVKDAASRAGVALDIAAHSLRAGFVTTALTAGKPERAVMNQTGHKSVMVMRGYYQRVNALQDNAAAGLL